MFKIDGQNAVSETYAKLVTLYGTDAAGVTAGQVVMLDTADTTNGAGNSVKIADAEDSPLVVGVAMETTTAVGAYAVQVAGTTSTTTSDSGGATTIGLLIGSGTGGGNGRVQNNAAWSQTAAPFAVCVTAHSGAAVADGAIKIIDKGWFND